MRNPAKIRAFTALFFLVSVFAVSGNDHVRVYQKAAEGERYDFFADNDHIVPVWISVTFPSLINLKASEPLPFRALIPPKSAGRPLFSLHGTGQGGRRSYRMLVSHATGDPAEARPDPEFLYLFPFRHGTKHQVTQGYKGAFTHGDENLYALDFDFDTGTPVTAARGGLVVEVKEDSSRGGPHASYAEDGNYILVRHDDGTFGNYVHLRRNGAIVEPGDRIEAGRHIGYSGSTGVSSGPHLHFDVRVPTEDGKMQSIPVRFLGHDGLPREPREGGYYYGFHPGKPPFPVVFGADLTEDQFAGYAGPAKTADKVDLRFDRIDSTYVVYVSNGFPEAREVTVDFVLRGLVPSRPDPVTVAVPPKTEKFLIILRADPKAAGWQYGYTIRNRPAR